MTKSNILTGISGEYFVAGELSRRGHYSSITLRNTKGVDIICSNEDYSKEVTIQVKTSKSSKRSWIVNKKSGKNYSKNHFYVFVNLNDFDSIPDYFIVPSKTVATYIQKDYQRWIKEGKKLGKKRKDSSIRKFNDEQGKFQNRWDLLSL